MELSSLAIRLRVTNRRAIDKAKEYQRLLQTRSCGSAVTVEAQSVACLDLGCRFTQTDIDQTLCMKYSFSKTPVAYSKMINSLSQLLGCVSIISTRELAIQFGCIQVNDLARKVLQSYKDKVRTSMIGGSAISTADSTSKILDTRNVYPCVAFYLSCKHMKVVGVDRKRLINTASVTEKEFQLTCESFYQHIPELKPPERKPSTPRKGQKRKKKSDDANDDEKEDDEGGYEGEEQKDGLDEDDEANLRMNENGDSTAALDDANSSPALNSNKRLGYEKWKQKVVQEAQEESKRLVQPMLKKRKSDPASAISSTSASPAIQTAATTKHRQAKLNFGTTVAAKQLTVESDGEEAEAEFD